MKKNFLICILILFSLRLAFSVATGAHKQEGYGDYSKPATSFLEGKGFPDQPRTILF